MEASDGERFEWHPRYRGRTVREVEAELRGELVREQRAMAVALEGAEQHENDALATVVRLEKKWAEFDLDWATADATELAARIAAFERERDRRRELFPYGEYRDRLAAATATDATADRPWWAFWRR